MRRKAKKACFGPIHLILALIVLIVSFLVYDISFPEIKRQTITEKMLIINQKVNAKIQQIVNTSDTEEQLDIINGFTQGIEAGKSAYIIENKLFLHLFKFMNSTNATVQEEATRALLNLSYNATNYPIILAVHGAVPPLLRLIHSPNDEISTMALLHFCLMIHERPLMGHKLLQMGLDKNLVQLINSEPSKEVLEIALPILSDICDYKNPTIPLKSANILLPAFTKLLHHYDNEIIEISISALLVLTENINQKLDFDIEMIKILIKLLNKKHSQTQYASIMLLARIVNDAVHDNVQNQFVLDDEILQLIPTMLNGSLKNFDQIALGLILQSVRYSSNQTSVIFEANLIPLIADKLMDEDSMVRRQAALILCFAVFYENKEHLTKMLDMQIIPKLYNVLIETDNGEIKRAILNAFNIFIQHADPEQKKNIYDNFEKLDAFKEFSKFRKHENAQIRNLAQSIFDFIPSEILETNVYLKNNFFV